MTCWSLPSNRPTRIVGLAPSSLAACTCSDPTLPMAGSSASTWSLTLSRSIGALPCEMAIGK